MNINNFIQRLKPLPISEITTLVNGRNKMPLLGFSTMKGNDWTTTSQCLFTAISKGVRLLDTAYSDMCEKVVGNVLKLYFKKGFVREDFCIISKLPAIGNRKSDVKKFLLKSLRNLGVSYVDIYLIESPVGLIGKNDKDVDPRDGKGFSVLDLSTDLASLWRGMEKQHRKGRAKFIGTCHFNIEQIGKIISNCKLRPSFAMMDINIYNHRVLERKWMYDHFINPLAIFTYGNPDFKTKPGCPPIERHPLVLHISEKYKVPPETVLVKYLVQRDLIAFIRSVSRNELSKKLKAYEKLNLNQRELVDLSCLDLCNLASLKNFIDYQGCELHPEFPFIYDIHTDGVMGGPWMSSRRVEPRSDWFTHAEGAIMKQKSPSTLPKDDSDCSKDSKANVPTGHQRGSPVHTTTTDTATTGDDNDYPSDKKPSSSKPSKETRKRTSDASAKSVSKKMKIDARETLEDNRRSRSKDSKVHRH